MVDEVKNNLGEYLKKINITPRMFSMVCKMSSPVIYRALRGERISHKHAKKIYRKSRGEVTITNTKRESYIGNAESKNNQS
jgi:hypothetical protein